MGAQQGSMQHMQESLPECPQGEQFQTVLSPYNIQRVGFCWFCFCFFEVSFKAEADCKLRVDEKTLMQLPAPKDPQAPGAQLLQLRAQCPKAHLRGSVPPGLIAPLISIPQKQNRAAVQLVSLMLKSHCRT